MPVDISNWMEKHSRDIGDLSDGEKVELGEACDEASYEAALKEYIEGNEDDLKEKWEELYGEMDTTDDGFMPFSEWLKSDEAREAIIEDFQENRSPDDYYPIWNTIWEFPSSRSAEELNNEGVPNLIFFDWDNVTWVGLTGCGMDLSPALYYAYLRFSDLNCNKAAILDGILRSGLNYYKYVLGSGHFFELVKLVGKKLMAKYDTESKRRYKEFDKTIEKLSKSRDAGDTDNFTAGLVGMMALLKTRKPMKG